MKKYSENGLWIEKNGENYRIGLSAKGQDDLGNISFVELLKQDVLTKNDAFISVEAAKAVTELLSPISGTVVKWHELLEDEPEKLNENNIEDSWIVEVTTVPEVEWNALRNQDLPIDTEK